MVQARLGTLSLMVAESRFGKGHLLTIENLSMLATLHMVMEEYETAQNYLIKVLTIQEREGYQGHTSTIPTLRNLSAVYASQGKYEEADSCSNHAISIQQRVAGNEMFADARGPLSWNSEEMLFYRERMQRLSPRGM